MRGDLGSQSTYLGLDDPGPGAVELGQFQLHGHPAGDLGRGPYEHRRFSRTVGHEGAENAVLAGERGDDGPAERALGVVAAGEHALAAPGVEDAGDAPHHPRRVVVGAAAVPGQDGVTVGEAQRLGAEQ